MNFTVKISFIFPIIIMGIQSRMETLKALPADKSDNYMQFLAAFKLKVKNTSISGLDHIKRQVYPFEVHNINTPSGYILTLHRIPYGMSSEAKGANPNPIILQHGTMQNSVHWLMSAGNNSLAYFLADNGFDVWLGNDRGNPFSKGHTSASPKDFSFWNFSFHEMGVEDNPTVIDYILEKTNKTKLSVVGFSMGATSFIISMSMRPEYNLKVHILFAVAPVIFLDHAQNPMLMLCRMPTTAKIFEFLRGSFKLGAVPNEETATLMGRIIPKFCQLDMNTAALCSVMLFSYFGNDPGQLDQHQLPIILNGPSYIVFKNIVHYCQITGAKRFQMFDYGDLNVEIYGRDRPPVYPLQKVSVPTAIMWSQNDYFCSVPDVARFASLLPNVVDNYRITLDAFNHFDFIYGLDSGSLVYEHLLSTLKNYVH